MDPHRTPLMLPALALAGGIVGRRWLEPDPRLVLGVALGLVALSAAALARGRARPVGPTLLLAFACVGWLAAGAPPPPASHVARLAMPRTVWLEARLLEEPVRWDPERTRLLLEAEAVLDGDDRHPISGQIQATLYGPPPALAEGQRVAAELRLSRPRGYRNPGTFDFVSHLERQGILVVGNGRADRVSPLTGEAPPWPARVKRWAVETIGTHLPPVSSALLAGLLLGERTALPGEIQDAFRRAGVYHILAVSGFNVALIASSVFFGAALLRMSRRLSALLAGGVLVGFAMVVGGQPSVLRATVMALAVLLAVLLERRAQLMNTLAMAWLALLLWNPRDLEDPGFQLSFAATAGIVHLAPAARDALVRAGLPAWAAAACAVSAAAQLAVTPVMLAHFNQLSLIGVVANLVVVPLAGLATILGALAVGTSLASEAAAAVLFDAVWGVVLALRASVWAAASLPLAMAHLPAPPWGGAAAWYGSLVLAPLGPGRSWVRGTSIALLAVAVSTAAWPWLRPGDGRLRVTFLDVGQGDAALVELPSGERVLVDAGPGGPGRFDAGERLVAPFLWNRAVRRLDVAVASHWDLDHAGGLAAVLRRFRVGEFWDAGEPARDREAVHRLAARAGALPRSLSRGQRLWIGNTPVTVLGPGPGDGSHAGPRLERNEASLVLRLDWGAVSILLPGDLGAPGEARLLERDLPLRALVLKVGHHGSRFSTGTPFLEAVRPALAVISAGSRNPFRHPAPATLDRLEAAGARIFRTDRDGAVILESDGASVWVTRWASGRTERFDLDPERPPENTAAPEKSPGAAAGRARNGRAQAS